MTKVKAAVLVEPRKIEVTYFDKPEVKKDAILMRTEICGICGTDVHIYEGRMKIQYPVILGHEFCGKVEEIGEEARRLEAKGQTLAEGDRITIVPGTSLFCGKCYFCKFMPHKPNLCQNRRAYGSTISCKEHPHLFGGYSEYVYVDPVHFWVYKLPADMPEDVAVLIEPMAVASRALERAFEPGLSYIGEGFGPCRSVVVQGAGPIGLLVLMVAKIVGAGKTIMIDMSDTRLKIAQKFGADHTLNIKDFSKAEDLISEVKKLTNGLGGDVVVECTGVPAAFIQGIEMTRNGGRYVEVGHFVDSGGIEIHPYVICRKDLDILGSWIYPPTQFETAINLLYSNFDNVPFRELVTHKFSLEETEKGIETMKKHEGLKIAIKP
ncbi:MAG: zinc-binding dehydrogenase [Candidatus Bathyarchaeia archaeon]